MKYLLDTANIESIRKYAEVFPIAGITSNPSIVKKEGSIDFFAHMNEIRSIIGKDMMFHIQVTATDSEGMLRDADTILNKVDSGVYIKVPVTMEGLPVIKKLSSQGVRTTGTGIYTKQQGFLAMEAGADFIAPYYNRMENMGVDSTDVIAAFADMIASYSYKTQILAASFKNSGQIERAIEAGAHTITADPSILVSALTLPQIKDAVAVFTSDWNSVFGGKVISEM